MSSTFEPKWTPGPWRWSNKGDVLILYRGRERGVVLRTQPQEGSGYDLNRYDAELIALAPELAAALIAYDDVYREHRGDDRPADEHPIAQSMFDLAERLRMIGADE